MRMEIWDLFTVHNGEIGNFECLKRGVEGSLSDELYRARKGTTDSEMFFLLLLNEGMDNDPYAAVRRVINILIAAFRAQNQQPFLRLSCVFSDGVNLYGFRYASDEFSPTLYLSKNLDNGGTCLASEPLEGNASNWEALKCGTFVQISPDKVEHTALDVSGCCASAITCAA